MKIVVLKESDVRADQLAGDAEQFFVENERPKGTGLCQSVRDSPPSKTALMSGHLLEVLDDAFNGVGSQDTALQDVSLLLELRYHRSQDQSPNSISDERNVNFW